MKLRSRIGIRSVMAVLFSVFALALLVPLSANAQVTVSHIKVTVGDGTSAHTTTYCDSNGTVCDVHVWDLTAAGITLAGGSKLVLTQTALITGVGGNFDTSDRARTGLIEECRTGHLCTVTIALDTGSGLANVYTDAVGDPLDDFNNDPGGAPFEYHPYGAAVVTTSTYSLQLGYADNAHVGCPAGGCFPSPFNGANGTATADVFLGHGVTLTGVGGVVLPCSPNCFDAGAILITGIAVPKDGRMTGGGSVFTADGTRVTHGFELHCDVLNLPNNLEINWPDANNFHLDVLTKVTCLDDPAIAPPPPNAPFDTLIGEGTGTLNGLPATIKFTLTDAGEPGTSDTAKYVITQGGVKLSVGPANLDKGNQQAHKQN